jgi:DNA-binding CsgD family transcriptional regulator
MDLDKIGPAAQGYTATYSDYSPETIECWNAIDNLLNLISCDLVHFSLYLNSQHSGKRGQGLDTPLIQRWAKYSGTEHIKFMQNESLPIPYKLIKNKSLEEVCSINSRNGGSNESFIYPLDGLGCIRMVFVDLVPLEKDVQSRRQKTIDHIFPHLTSCFSQWLCNRQRLIDGKQLTTREMEVLHWIKEGKSTWESAQILGITERTVKYHLKNIFRKLDVNNRTQAVGRAIDQGLF